MPAAKYSDGSFERFWPGGSQFRCRLKAWSMRYMKCGTQPASASTHTTRSSGWRSNTPPSTSVPMMSWQPRITDKNPFIFGPRIGDDSRVVRMWNEIGSSRSIAASQNAS